MESKDQVISTSPKAILERICSDSIPSSPVIVVANNKAVRNKFAMDLAGSVIRQSSNPSTEAKITSGSHPDIFEMRPEGKSDLYLMETIKYLINDISLLPYEARHKVYICHDADKMLPVHANALLKTLEEKPNHAVICLTTANVRKLLPTIISRCQVIRPMSDEEVLEDEGLREAVLGMFFSALGREYLAQQQHLQSLLSLIEASPREGLASILKYLLYASRDLEVVRLGGEENQLTYPDQLKYYNRVAKMKQVTFEKIVSMESLVEDAVARHMRPKLVLEYIFLKLSSL